MIIKNIRSFSGGFIVLFCFAVYTVPADSCWEQGIIVAPTATVESEQSQSFETMPH